MLYILKKPNKHNFYLNVVPLAKGVQANGNFPVINLVNTQYNL